MATRQQLLKEATAKGLKGPLRTAWVGAQLANVKLQEAREAERAKRAEKAERDRIKRESARAKKQAASTRRASGRGTRR